MSEDETPSTGPADRPHGASSYPTVPVPALRDVELPDGPEAGVVEARASA